MCEPLDTTRLRVFASTLAIEQAILADERVRVAQLTGLAVPAAWPGEDWCAVLPHFIQNFMELPEWCAWNRLIAHREDRTLIGGIGTLVPPDADGTVSIGFYLVPEYRRQRYMREAAQAYVAWLLHQPAVSTITAQCHRENIASRRILASVGLQEDGQISDEEGEKICWRLVVDR